MPITFKQLGNQGRAGNSRFQAATVIALAERNNDSYVFPHCDLENGTNIPKKHFVNKASIVLGPTHEDPNFHYTPIPYKKNLNLSGYFQSEKYFTDCKNKIRNLFTPKMDIKPLTGVTSIHVRRGDYLQPHLAGCFCMLGPDYYRRAMNIIKSDKYFVFSDDIPWCKKVFTGKKFHIVEGNNPSIDLNMLTKVENCICANSSFSWWGAWLNRNPNKKVITPLRWFGPKLAPTHNTKDLIPGGWLRI